MSASNADASSTEPIGSALTLGSSSAFGQEFVHEADAFGHVSADERLQLVERGLRGGYHARENS